MAGPSISVAVTDGADLLGSAGQVVGWVNNSSATVTWTNNSSVTLAWTNNVQVNGGPIVSATVSTTDGADTFVGNFSFPLIASLNYTDGTDTFSGNLSPIIGASLTYTDGADTFAGSSSTIIGASLTYTDGADSFAGLFTVTLPYIIAPNNLATGYSQAGINLDALSYVEFGDIDGLQEFLWHNAIQHRVFYETMMRAGLATPDYPLIDADPKNLDDWLLLHNQQHEAVAKLLGLDNPFQLLDADFNVEEDFYDWIGVHQTIHEQIASKLGVT